MTTDADLLHAAAAARAHAVCPFSGFAVGAALLAADGRVFTGCNVENSTYGLTVCAERVALFKALSEGVRQFAMIAVAAASPKPTPPCGPCRQLLWEFGGDLPVLLGDAAGTPTGRFTVRELLPHPFDAGHFREP